MRKKWRLRYRSSGVALIINYILACIQNDAFLNIHKNLPEGKQRMYTGSTILYLRFRLIFRTSWISAKKVNNMNGFMKWRHLKVFLNYFYEYVQHIYDMNPRHIGQITPQQFQFDLFHGSQQSPTVKWCVGCNVWVQEMGYIQKCRKIDPKLEMSENGFKNGRKSESKNFLTFSM